MSAPSLSVVVPALDAEAQLAECLAALGEADEIIVVDGGSTDATADIALAAGARLVRSPPGRGIQLAAGADVARGRWLLFLHADTVLGPDWAGVVAQHMRQSPAAAHFRFRLADPSWQARALERAVACRAAWIGLPYGDQGLLVSRALYDRVGGYRPLPLMEDVDLVRRIGRRRLSRLAAAATTSAARWRRDGWARRSLRNLSCLTLYALGVPPARIAALYE